MGVIDYHVAAFKNELKTPKVDRSPKPEYL